MKRKTIKRKTFCDCGVKKAKWLDLNAWTKRSVLNLVCNDCYRVRNSIRLQTEKAKGVR